MKIRINGTDISNMVKTEGAQWQRNDVEGPNAGRNLNATMIRDRVAIKLNWTISCRMLTKAEAQRLLSLIEPEYVSVVIDDPLRGDGYTSVYYSNNVPASYKWTDPDGVEWWEGITFPLVEV